MSEEKKLRVRENAKRYYHKNKEKILKRQKEYAKKRYREDEKFRNKIKEKNKNYVINNPEKAREIKRKSQYKYINKKRLSGELPLTQKMLIDNLQQENQQLKDRIDKAIEYIEKCNPDVDLHNMFLNENYISNYGACELLEILKGDKDE
ncbi:MAG: hypothetical protein IJ501_06655 [Bacilli bacterium]|nr:hypothetical protein [Bacilli bacterium]